MTWNASISLIFLLFSFCLNAQKVKVFNDEYGKQGEIRFSGTYSDSVLPQQGFFDIRWRKMENNQLKTYKVTGQTKNFLPVGKWIWEEAEWEYEVNAGKGITPVFSAKGVRMKWDGFFQNGTPDGKWVYTLDSITSEGKTIRNLIKTDAQFKKGVVSGNISISDNFTKNGFNLKGNCDNGTADGTWTYSYKNSLGNTIKEERIYKKGLLVEVRTVENGSKTVKPFEKNVRYLESLTNQHSFEEKIGNYPFEQDEYGGIASELFHENMHHYFLQGWSLDVFPFEVIRLIPTFRRLEYPLTEQETNDFIHCRQLTGKQKQIIEELLDGNISIHRSRSGELDTCIAFLQLNYERLNYIDSLLNRVEHPFFTYKNRYEQAVLHWVEGLNKMRHTRGELYDSLHIELDFISTNGDSLHIFEELKAVLENNERTFPAYYQTVVDAHISVKQEGELKKLEDQIVELLKEQQLFYSEKAGISALIHNKWIKGEIQTLLQEYARSDDYQNALQIGNRILVRLDSLNAWQQKTEVFETMSEVLKTSYTYLAYNPYSGENDIPITTKKRFLSTILTNLWPYMQAEIEQETDWNTWILLWERQFNVFNYLLNFATKEDAHSKRTDKRIRKEKKPERMLRIILQQIEL